MATISQALAIALQHHQAGRLQAAERIYRQILHAEPNQADALHLLGLMAHQAGKHAVAVQYIRRAIEFSGRAALFHNSLGEAYRALGGIPEAIACYRRGLELKPDYAEAHNNLGNALKQQGKLDEAIACYRRALERKPDFAEAHSNLGLALGDQRQLDEAVACFRRALELKPDRAEIYNNLGLALAGQGKLDESLAACRRALELKPEFAEAHANLGNTLQDQGRLDEAHAAYRRALELKPDFAEVHSNLLLALHYGPDATPAALAEAHAQFDRLHAAPLGGAAAEHQSIPDRRGRLRLGFVSPDLRRHPVGYFLVRVLENLDRERYETICYSDRIGQDGLTRRLQAAAAAWRDVIGMSDEQLAQAIRADRIDVLFDLAGHTARNRLLVFARKPARRQITWIGYEGTTGLAAMDCLLADRHVVPQGAEPYYRERVLRMPDGYLCYDPPQQAPPAGPPPSSHKGYATFGSFNNPAKITPEVVAVWAEILRRMPAARLVLKYRGLGEASVKARYLDLFASHGVDPRRLDLLPWSSHAEYLAAYQQVDVALDPFPFSGSVTTCEALWMGVPVVTCPGETFASRHSLSHLSNVGLTETIAGDLHEYVERAVSLAGDLPRLTELRAGLRERMAASPLCDGSRFANHLASLLDNL
jgi:predicted O-linked N-acetylglucosamine transferase (SPINDLY family)